MTTKTTQEKLEEARELLEEVFEDDRIKLNHINEVERTLDMLQDLIESESMPKIREFIRKRREGKDEN